MKKKVLSLVLALTFALVLMSTTGVIAASENALILEFPNYRLEFTDSIYIGVCTIGELSARNKQHFDGELKESDVLHVFLLDDNDNPWPLKPQINVRTDDVIGGVIMPAAAVRTP
jgi:hypothetical protein